MTAPDLSRDRLHSEEAFIRYGAVTGAIVGDDDRPELIRNNRPGDVRPWFNAGANRR